MFRPRSSKQLNQTIKKAKPMIKSTNPSDEPFPLLKDQEREFYKLRSEERERTIACLYFSMQELTPKPKIINLNKKMSA